MICCSYSASALFWHIFSVGGLNICRGNVGRCWQWCRSEREAENNWQGSNLTYYGFFIATSQLISLTLLLILLGAMGLSIPGTMLAILIVLAFCIPAARLMAMLVEKKRHTFTIGGASFIGILLAPWSIQLSNTVLSSADSELPIIPVLAAMAIAYTLGRAGQAWLYQLWLLLR